jgi:hypothetical protein
MDDLIKQLGEIGEESPAFDGLMRRLEILINSTFSFGSLQEVDDTLEEKWIQ